MTGWQSNAGPFRYGFLEREDAAAQIRPDAALGLYTGKHKDVEYHASAYRAGAEDLSLGDI